MATTKPEIDLSLPAVFDFARRIATVVRELADGNAPELGIASSPRVLIFENGPTKVFYYKASSQDEDRPMVLLVPSLINRPFIFDLIPDRSLIAFLRDQGIDVYLLDWGVPKSEHAFTTFDEYLTDYYHEAVEAIKNHGHREQVSILGYCIGGLLSMLYSSLYPQNVNALVNLASPVDFAEAGIMRSWVDKSGVDLEQLINAHGNVPPSFLFLVFAMLKPTSKASAFRIFYERREDKNFNHFHRAMDYWANHNIPVPGAFARRYIKELYQENRLLHRTLTVAGKIVDLSNFTGRFLNIMADNDHIVPGAAAKKAESLVGSSDITSWQFNTGHVGLMVGSKAKANMWPSLADWLRISHNTES